MIWICPKYPLLMARPLLSGQALTLLVAGPFKKKKKNAASLDGNSEIDAHFYIKIGNLICIKHLFRWAAVPNFNINLQTKKAHRVLSYHQIEVPY